VYHWFLCFTILSKEQRIVCEEKENHLPIASNRSVCF